MTPQRRLEIEQHANLYGSANCWAGTSGTLATMIRELLGEVDNLDRQLDVMDDILTRVFRRANNVATAIPTIHRPEGAPSVVSNRQDNSPIDADESGAGT